MIRFLALIALAAFTAVVNARPEVAELSKIEEQYRSLLVDLYDFSYDESNQILQDAAKAYNKPRKYPGSTSPIIVDENRALALPIWYHFKSQWLGGLRSGTKFESIYDEFVSKQCLKYQELDGRLKEFIDTHKEIDDRAHRNGSLPDLWTETLDVCKTQMGDVSKEAVLKICRDFKRRNYVEPNFTD